MVDTIDDGSGAGKPDDPFDLAALRQPQNVAQVRHRRLSVPVRRKPNRLDFVRTHPDPAYRVPMWLFRPGRGDDNSSGEEIYFVHNKVVQELESECRLHTIFTGVNLQGSPFLWCVPEPLDDGREPNTWLVTNREAAELAMQRWVRVASDMGAGAYCVHEYEGPPIEPKWPEESFLDLLKLGFKHRMIDHPEHPMIMRLRGLA
jgi:hypothetical protein